MSNTDLIDVSNVPEKAKIVTIKRVEPGLVIAIAILVIAFLFVVMPWAFTSYSPVDEVGEHLVAPNFTHIFGTDELGRDLYARIVYGAVHSLTGALAAVLFGFILGGFLGLVSGSIGGLVDTIIMRIVDVLLSIPSLLLSLSVITLMGFGSLQIAVAVGVTSVAGFSRLMRAEVARIKSLDYIEAAYGSGATFFAVIWRHILPNALYTVISYAALQFGHALLQIATLGFLGYGVQPPTPEWGLIIAEGRNYIATGWWLTTIPGLVTIAVVLSFNRISRLFSAKGRW
ncbi:ABC transporter permease [Bartonella choladocola]|uniref:Peptide/nickel transport system permease protein n=1 Tax=Bartonella choladocola TaxID=2750995 RepID=A0A1U9MIB4_9HYPH|nr:ABC transporter permease [Bartonella choladocola]AQT47687.1 peptide/nickel transport system permease protein [Bartonella choladocola]